MEPIPFGRIFFFFSISLFDFTWMLLLLETKGVSLGSDEAASSGASCSASSAPK